MTIIQKMFTFFAVAAIITVPAIVNGQIEQALKQPIVEGKSIMGVKLGDHESDIYQILGFPDKIISDFNTEAKGMKVLFYSLCEDDGLIVFTNKTKVESIILIYSGNGSPFYKGKTTKGLGLGDDLNKVEQVYGKCSMSKIGLCWYKDKGIALLGEKKVTYILITQPAEELFEYLKPGL